MRPKESCMNEQVAPSRPEELSNGVEAKRPYTPPELVRYGTIEEITAIKVGTAVDGVVASQP